MADLEISVRQIGGIKDTSYKIDDDLKGELTIEELFNFTKGALIQLALDGLKEEQSRGFDKNPLKIIDNVRDRNLSDISPLGTAEFYNTDLSQTKIVLETYKAILNRSKVVTGTYIQNNYVFFNGTPIASSLAELESWGKSDPKFSGQDIVRFVNIAPYARKLERHGITAQRSSTRTQKSKNPQKSGRERVLAPNGVYFLTSRSVSRLYKNIQVFFGFVSGSELPVTFPQTTNDGKPLRTTFKGSRKNPKNTGPYIYPSIRLIFKEK